MALRIQNIDLISEKKWAFWLFTKTRFTMKIKSFLIAIIGGAIPLLAQVSTYNDGIVPSANHADHPAPKYAYVREADLMWAKRIWRVVDFREKLNQYLLFPLTENNNRINLITVLQHGIRNGDLVPFDPFQGDDFKVKMSTEEALLIGSGSDTIPLYNANPPYDYRGDTVIPRPFNGFTVKKLRIKEDWFFDSKRSVMEVRIVGICPVMTVEDPVSGEVRGELPMYWIHYEQARDFLASYRIYNPYNYAQRITYDDAFIKRIFSSLIYKEDNSMDRRIAEYTTGMDALLEADHIKNELFTFEHDLWEQ